MLTFFQVESSDLALKSYGENLYDNIVLMAPQVDSFSTISFDDISDFVQESGGNLIIAVNKDVSDSLREFIETVGVVLDKKGTEVIDHFEREDSLDTT